MGGCWCCLFLVVILQQKIMFDPSQVSAMFLLHVKANFDTCRMVSMSTTGTLGTDSREVITHGPGLAWRKRVLQHGAGTAWNPELEDTNMFQTHSRDGVADRDAEAPSTFPR